MNNEQFPSSGGAGVVLTVFYKTINYQTMNNSKFLTVLRVLRSYDLTVLRVLRSYSQRKFPEKML